MVTRLARFRRSESGVTLIEGLIVFPLMLTLIIGFVEFGYGIFQWEQTGRAIAVGARLAAVSDPVVPKADYNALAVYSGGSPGDPVPPTDVSKSPDVLLRASCIGAATAGVSLPTCVSARFDKIWFGSDSTCSLNYGGAVPGICDVNPALQKSSIVVSYTRDGLGYVGRTSGPVVNVTVYLREAYFRTFLIGPLFKVDRLIPIPRSPVTVTGEDLASCNTPAYTTTDFWTPCT